MGKKYYLIIEFSLKLIFCSMKWMFWTLVVLFQPDSIHEYEYWDWLQFFNVVEWCFPMLCPLMSFFGCIKATNPFVIWHSWRNFQLDSLFVNAIYPVKYFLMIFIIWNIVHLRNTKKSIMWWENQTSSQFLDRAECSEYFELNNIAGCKTDGDCKVCCRPS